MSTALAIREFRSDWLPHATTDGLMRIVELLEQSSPLLIYGSFSRCHSQGCLATHLAWHHPVTADLCDAGVVWLTKVAHLNPATSAMILSWDRMGVHDWELRHELIAETRAELERRKTVACQVPESQQCDDLSLCSA